MRWLYQAGIFLLYCLAVPCFVVLVAIACALNWLYRRRGWPDGQDAINCWAYAIPRWLQAGTYKTYLIIRKSKHTVMPHVAFAESIAGLKITEANPAEPQRGVGGFFKSFLHRVRIRTGKGEEKLTEARHR